MRLRKAEIKDSSEITRIQIEAWRHSYSNFIAAKVLSSLSFESRKAKWEELIRGEVGRLILAETENKVAGFLHLDTPSGNSIELIRLYVAPEQMHKGLGSLLLDDAMRFVKIHGITQVYLWVAELNVIARKFYEKHGFKLVEHSSRLDSFSADGSPPQDVRNKNDLPDSEKGEFREVCYSFEF